MTWLEETAHVSLHLAVKVVLPVSFLFGIYVVGGLLGTTMELFSFPYPFLSLEADPLFDVLAASIGILICIATSSLLFLTALVGSNNFNVSQEIVILFSFIGLGFGASIIRFAALTAINTPLGIC